MSAQANIVAFDGAATPASHTFVPVGAAALTPSNSKESSELRAEWLENLSTVPTIAQAKVSTSKRKLANGMFRVSIQVEVPVMESVSGQNAAGYTAAPKVAYINKFTVVGNFHERSTIAERRLARQLAVNITNGIATTVTPVTTGAAAELFDQLISAS